MKEMFEKLYTNEYFPVVLFSAIGILVILFIIVLILALRDAKKNSKNKIAVEVKENSDLSLKNEPLKEDNVNIASEEVENNFQFEDIDFELPKKENVDFDTMSGMKKVPSEDAITIDLPLPKEEVPKQENYELPKPNLNEEIPISSNSEAVKVVNTESVINAKSLNDIRTEEYRIK